MIGSTPTLHEFSPFVIPMQAKVLKDIAQYDYSLGTHEVLLSGSVGSSKSLLLAHIILRHCLENNNARALIGRRALPDLKDTLFLKICEHMQSIDPRLYNITGNTGRIQFRNGSEIISRSWADKHYSKLRSLELSMAAIEELTENDGDDAKAYTEIKMRVGRLPHVKRPLIICATNPDSPAHWAHKYFIKPNTGEKHKTRHVYYSRTEDNPFLPRSYIDQLKTDLDPKMARRMLHGEWIEISKEILYYMYDSARHYWPNSDFSPQPGYPILLSYDFNIGIGKPMSAIAAQYINGHLHVFKEWVIEGGNTSTIMEAMADDGLFNQGFVYEIHGDASGKNRDTRNIRSDYDIIKHCLNNYGVQSVYRVPLANPAIRTRHNIVNAWLLNDSGEQRITLYRPCKVLDEGMRLTHLKKGNAYIEDDSKHFQHVTTALGYLVVQLQNSMNRKPQRTETL